MVEREAMKSELVQLVESLERRGHSGKEAAEHVAFIMLGPADTAKLLWQQIKWCIPIKWRAWRRNKNGSGRRRAEAD